MSIRIRVPVGHLLSDVTETPENGFQSSLLVASFEENPHKLFLTAREEQSLLVSLSSFSDFSPMASCSSKVYVKLDVMVSSETLIAWDNVAGFLQFIKGIFLAHLR